MSTKAKPTKSKIARPPRGKRAPAAGPVPKDSPKGRVAALMLTGELTFEEIAAKAKMTTGNVRQHAQQLKARGFAYQVAEDGKVNLLAKADEVLS